MTRDTMAIQNVNNFSSCDSTSLFLENNFHPSARCMHATHRWRRNSKHFSLSSNQRRRPINRLNLATPTSADIPEGTYRSAFRVPAGQRYYSHPLGAASSSVKINIWKLSTLGLTRDKYSRSSLRCVLFFCQ